MTNDYVTNRLPVWLRAVELEPNGGRLVAIESSAIHLGKTLSGRDVLDMTLLAHGRSQGNAFEVLNGSVREHDPTFGCRADDLESRIAAGAAVSALLVNESKSASVAAQAILSAKWVGLSPAVPELPELAVATTRRRSEMLRMRRSLPSTPARQDFFRDVAKTWMEVNEDEAATYRELQRLAKAAQVMANKLQAHQHSYSDVLAARLDAADEELNVLWWAFSGYSELGKNTWARLAPETAALLCGIELGNKLAFEIELPSTEALITRLLGPDVKEPVSLVKAVEGAAAVLESLELPAGHPLLPILSSISEHRALHGNPSWRGSVDRWKIDPDHSAEKLAFACQAVRERAVMGNISDG